jgi:hypothetical protein
MQTTIKIFLIIICFNIRLQIFSQDACDSDVKFANETSNNIYLKAYPVSMVFNKPFPIWQYPGNYDLHSQYPNQYLFYLKLFLL